LRRSIIRAFALHDAGSNYLVMELVEGETLAARLKRSKLPLRETLRFGCQIAEALAVAHAAGIVHRDLRPANIMLTKSGVKVLDFGLAKSAIDPGLTATGRVMGTPAYMAPERLEGKESDARADIYAPGLILAEMATGKRSRDPAGLPAALERVVKRCVEADPDDRWQSARDLQWELESTTEALAAAPAGSVREAGGRSRSWNALLVRALGVAVVLAAALAFLRYRERPALPPLARVNVLLPEKSRVLWLAVSPNGRAIAAVLVKDGKQQIWVRALDATSPTFQAGTPRALFDTEMVDTGIRTGPFSWDIAPDGKRFLIISPNSSGTSSVNVVLNWQANGH
jgi:eukaryotic-like serine/threonine-protein kinase